MPLDKLFTNLGLYSDNGLYKKGDPKIDFPFRIKNIINNIDFDAIFFVNDKPMIIFKEFNNKSAFEKRIDELHKNIWNLGEIPILFIQLDEEYLLYNINIFNGEKIEVWKHITEDSSNELDDFSYLNIKSGSLWEKYQSDFRRKNKVDDYLIRNLRSAKHELVKKSLPFEVINNLIGRLIFSRFLFDRDIINRNKFKKHFGKDFEDIIKNKNKLYEFFNCIKNRFNGTVFEINDEEWNNVNSQHLKILFNLFKGHDLECGQKVLFDVYDFSIIPVELVSCIYESFLEEEKQQKDGVYYTPLSLVDYILNDTVNEKLQKKSECKILDPSCGSGIFLVESLRKLLENEENLSLDRLNEIVTKNIYGIDIDINAVNISIFSVYLTMLDYIKTHDFKFPKLLNKNFFVDDFFNEKSKFNNITDFDVIAGNPPWVRVKGEKQTFEKYCKENNIPIHNRQISEAFLVRSSDFINNDGIIALIVSSKIFYNPSDLLFREYLLKNFILVKVFDLSFVRKNLFSNAKWPSTILFYKKKESKELNNVIKHISSKPNHFSSLFKRIVVQKYDIKSINQSKLLKYDWLWKVLLVGNSLDFDFIKKLKKYESLLELINDESNNLTDGVGFKPPSQKSKNKHNASKFKGMDFLRRRNLEKYGFSCKDFWEYDEYVSGNENLLNPPNILLNRSTNSKFGAIGSFSNENIIFDFDIIAINGSKEDIRMMKSILGAINSSLFNYFSLMTTSIGTAVNQTSKPEKFAFPLFKDVLNNEILFEKVEKIENAKKINNVIEFQNLENEINNIIYDIYQLTEIEKDLISYSFDVTIPLIKSQNEKIRELNRSDLKNYAEVFYNHFKKAFHPKFFAVDIYSTKYFIGMNFKISEDKQENEIVFEENRNCEEIINLFGLKTLEIGEIFVQRDIKTFNDNSFSIIKSKELKNWHKAVAWLDIGDIVKFMFNSYNSLLNKEYYDE
ncbi:MAG: SAM-dependent methyltransferase [Methanobrevibacter sp.]|jgi:hypothetical protein|nr:SAM-dependent methyltransferase [Candidatus Methanovirga australis]